MVRYHYFETSLEAEVFVTAYRASGGLCYLVGRTCGEYEVRTLH